MNNIANDASDEAAGGRRARRGRPLTVSRGKVIEIAVRQIQDHGAEGFSMRGVAEEVGVTAMALYHHFDGKNALIAEAFLHILRSRSPAELPHDPVERVVAICNYIIDQLEDFPFAKEMMASGEDTSSVFGPLYREFARTAHGSGARSLDIVRTVQALRRIIVGEVMVRKVDGDVSAAGETAPWSGILPDMLPWDSDDATRIIEEGIRAYSVDDLVRGVAVDLLGVRGDR